MHAFPVSTEDAPSSPQSARHDPHGNHSGDREQWGGGTTPPAGHAGLRLYNRAQLALQRRKQAIKQNATTKPQECTFHPRICPEVSPRAGGAGGAAPRAQTQTREAGGSARTRSGEDRANADIKEDPSVVAGLRLYEKSKPARNVPLGDEGVHGQSYAGKGQGGTAAGKLQAFLGTSLQAMINTVITIRKEDTHDNVVLSKHAVEQVAADHPLCSDGDEDGRRVTAVAKMTVRKAMAKAGVATLTPATATGTTVRPGIHKGMLSSDLAIPSDEAIRMYQHELARLRKMKREKQQEKAERLYKGKVGWHDKVKKEGLRRESEKFTYQPKTNNKRKKERR